MREGFSRFAGRDLVVDEGAFASELESAHHNLGMAHLLKASGTLDCDPVEVVEGYTRQCSITVSCRDRHDGRDLGQRRRPSSDS